MTSSAAVSLDVDWTPDNAVLVATCTRLREEIARMEGVVSAALVVTSAFRLREERGLVEALRALSESLDVLRDSE